MKHTDLQLQLALAKMLPEKVFITYDIGNRPMFRWDTIEINRPIEDTEWLHVCWLIEETLSRLECCYFGEYLEEGRTEQKASGYYWHLSWQQRTIALAKVKGIEIV